MCRILVAYASRAGSTREIAEAVADELRQTDHSVTVASCDDAPDADGFDAVVIGSALYADRWLPTASRYLRRQRPHLQGRPTYLFQSGPCRPRPEEGGPQHDAGRTPVPRVVRRLGRQLGLAHPVTFAGRLDPADSRLSRWLAAAAPSGDFRDWEEIRAWGYANGTELQERAVLGSGQPPRRDRPVGRGSR